MLSLFKIYSCAFSRIHTKKVIRYYFLQCLITNDNILSLKSLFSGIPVQNMSWLKNLISSNLKLLGKC